MTILQVLLALCLTHIQHRARVIHLFKIFHGVEHHLDAIPELPVLLIGQIRFWCAIFIQDNW
jgi:hypothetical protein